MSINLLIERAHTMSYYNWKTGRWATYNQCSQTPIVAKQELTLEKYDLEKIEEEAPPRSRTKQIFDAYLRFENRLCGRMLGKGYHLFAVALTSWLLRAVVVGAIGSMVFGLFYLVYAIVMFVFKMFLLAIAVVMVLSFFAALAARVVFVI